MRLAWLALVVLIVPIVAQAYPFGGQASIVRGCYNSAIFARLGPPNGGDFVWTPSTRTYQFGPPKSVGQWLLGLSGVPYMCIVSISPVDSWPADSIFMMGSSYASGFNFGGGSPGTGVPPVTLNPSQLACKIAGVACSGQSGENPSTAPNSGGAVNHILVSEVYPFSDSSHGTDAENLWIELYNPTASPVDISRWTIATSRAQATIAANTVLNSGAYIVISPTVATAQYWRITPSLVVAAVFSQPMLQNEQLILRDSSGVIVDALSWGTDTAVFATPASTPPRGSSLIRSSLARDTDSASDWVSTGSPTPGR
ncbi:lamin tail domain-containing protein [bacterium]|nr:lamin tail domain-containing protein [bacterium]